MDADLRLMEAGFHLDLQGIVQWEGSTNVHIDGLIV